MNEMVERVMKAITDAAPAGRWGAAVVTEAQARAAIEAMREPTDDMCRAGCRSIFQEPDAEWHAIGVMGEGWQAMIDNALGEKSDVRLQKSEK